MASSDKEVVVAGAAETTVEQQEVDHTMERQGTVAGGGGGGDEEGRALEAVSDSESKSKEPELQKEEQQEKNENINDASEQHQQPDDTSLVDSTLTSAIQELPSPPALSRVMGPAAAAIPTTRSIPGAHAVGGIPRGMRLLLSTINNTSNTRSIPPTTTTTTTTTVAPMESIHATLADDDDGDGGDLRLVDQETGVNFATEEATANTDSSSAFFQVQEVLEGKPMTTTTRQHQEQQSTKKGWFHVFGCVVVAVAILSLILFNVLGATTTAVASGENNSKSDDESSSANLNQASQAPSELLHLHENNDKDNGNILSRLPPFDDDLPEIVSTAILEGDAESSFYKANQWLLSDPNYNNNASYYTPQRKRNRFYLAMIYFAFNGDWWINNTNWLSYDISECLWFSKSTFPPDSPYYQPNLCQQKEEEDDETTIINLSLASNNLTGSFPIWYSSFTPQLKILDIGKNSISGWLPPITAPEKLEILVLSHNPFVGPARISGKFDNLKVLLTDGTDIRGNNNGALTYITPKLELMNATDQPHYGGKIWSSYGQLQHLQFLGYGHGDGTIGSIPTQIGLATSLRELDFSSLPELNGTIPSELGQLTHLTKLDLSDTPLTGTVPAELCHMVEEGFLELVVDCDTGTDFHNLECCHF